MSKLYLVTGSRGEYSDRIEWPVALYETKAEARAVAEKAAAFVREQCAKRGEFRVWLSEKFINPYDPPDEEGWGGKGESYWVTAVEIRKFDAE